MLTNAQAALIAAAQSVERSNEYGTSRPIIGRAEELLEWLEEQKG